MQTHIVDHLEKEVDWSRFFGIVDSLYADKGFSTNADNFTRVIALEKALDACSGFNRVDRKGYDFLYGDIKIELKVSRQLFFKRNPNTTKDFKVKSFLSSIRTVEDFKEETTFDWLMVIDLSARRVVLVPDDEARKLYRPGADGAIMSLKLGDYYECEIGEVNPNKSKMTLSSEINDAIDRFIASF
jgi:hypothetical protein